MRAALWLLTALLAAAACHVAHAQDEDADPVDEVPPATEAPAVETDEEDGGISSVVYFPSHPKNAFPAGSEVSALIGVSNSGKGAYAILAVDGALAFPPDMSYRVQNFTRLTPNFELDAGQQATFLYKFRPLDKTQEPRQIGLVLALTYRDGNGNQYTTGVFNQTVSITEAEDDFDFASAIGYTAVVIGLGVAVFFFVFKNQSDSKKESKTRETGTKAAVEDEWLIGTHAVSPGGSKKRKGSKKSD